MSLKANVKLAAAVALAGFASGAVGDNIAEGMLNDANVYGANVVETDASGACVVFAKVGADEQSATMRPVTDAMGNVRVFGNVQGAMSTIKRARLLAGSEVSYTKFVEQGSVGNPVKTLIAKHKSAKSETTKATDNLTAAQSEKTAAEAQGWQNASGTPEGDQYADIVKRIATLTEWKNDIAARLQSYTDALVAAHIDPVTYKVTVAP